MALDDSPRSGPPSSRYLGAGFRQEPDFRDGAPAIAAAPAAQPPAEPTAVTITKRSAPPNLEYVFDDPAEGEPGRDGMLVHGLLELVLAALVVIAYLLLSRANAGAFTGVHLRALLVSVAAVGLLGMAVALSLRTGVPNLAVGAVAVAAGLYFTGRAGQGLLVPLLVVIGLAAAIGAVQGLVVVGLQVPAWAGGLGVAVAVLAWSARQPATSFAGYDPLPHAYWWLGGFAVVSVIAGAVGVVPGIRRVLGRFRPVADPADRRGGVAAMVAFVATVGSSILAGVAGVLLVAVHRAAAPTGGLELTALAFGVALLGGTSAYGRRGGVLGTLFAAGLVAVFAQYASVAHRSWPLAVLAAVAVGLGLVVTRLVERFGRPDIDLPEEDEDDWVPRLGAFATDGAPRQPAHSAPGGLWSGDDSWGSTDQR